MTSDYVVGTDGLLYATKMQKRPSGKYFRSRFTPTPEDLPWTSGYEDGPVLREILRDKIAAVMKNNP
jgi:hypothetical protein